MADFGQLVPTGGGETIVLKKDKLVVGRREGCDIVLRFTNVSSQHARLTLEDGYWFVKDLQSSNGTKVDGMRVDRKRLDPESTVAFAKHAYTIHYNPEALGGSGSPPPDDDHVEEVLRRSLMDRAGLSRRSADNSYKNRDILAEEEENGR